MLCAWLAGVIRTPWVPTTQSLMFTAGALKSVIRGLGWWCEHFVKMFAAEKSGSPYTEPCLELNRQSPSASARNVYHIHEQVASNF